MKTENILSHDVFLLNVNFTISIILVKMLSNNVKNLSFHGKNSTNLLTETSAIYAKRTTIPIGQRPYFKKATDNLVK